MAKNETITLLKTLLHCNQISENLLNFLLEKSGSMPFYVSELALNLLNNDLIYIKEGTAQLKEKGEFKVPRSLDELVMTKIDKLPSDLRYIVDICSVIGEEFSFKLLSALIPGKESLRQNLAFIITQNIIRIAEGSALPEEEKYGFTHSIIRDAVYNSLLKKERQEYHQRIAYTIEKVFNLTIEEYYDALANHFYYGGELLKAIEYMEKAGDQKKALYLNNSAIEIYNNCLKLIPDNMHQIRARIYEKLADIYALLGDYKDAFLYFKKMFDCAEKDFLLRARSLREQALVLTNQGNYDKALDFLLRAKQELELTEEKLSTGALRELSEITCDESWLHRIKGRMDFAETKGMDAINIIKKIKNWEHNINLKQTLARAYNNLAVICHIKGDFNKAIMLCNQALSITEELGQQRRKCTIYNTLGSIYRMRGEYDKAIDAFTMYLKISEELEDKYNIGIAYCNLGNVYQNMGEFPTAIDLYEKSLKISEELGDKAGIGSAINNIGIIYFNKGEYDKAIELFERYAKINKEMGEKRGEAIAYGNLGEIYYNKFEYKKAIELFKKYLEMSKQLDAKRETAMASYNLGQVYTEIGNLKLAQKYLTDAKLLFEGMGNKIYIGMVTNSLAYLKFRQGKIEEAIALLESAQSIAEQMNMDELKVYCLLYSGIIFTKTDSEKAEMSFQEAIKICQKNKYKKTLADVYYEYAGLLKSASRQKEMERYYNEAMKIYRSMNIKRRDSMKGK
ncbi:MAG: tetratricopeptide repeat protein [candidate division WOR-3 bacterium]